MDITKSLVIFWTSLDRSTSIMVGRMASSEPKHKPKADKGSKTPLSRITLKCRRDKKKLWYVGQGLH
ncbi:hypothetical protein E2P81_ATG02441 [Venturia nashicola]|nr:hypothetical protein E2P81_ATG02441 [Venturia nashicola]